MRFKNAVTMQSILEEMAEKPTGCKKSFSCLERCLQGYATDVSGCPVCTCVGQPESKLRAHTLKHTHLQNTHIGIKTDTITEYKTLAERSLILLLMQC